MLQCLYMFFDIIADMQQTQTGQARLATFWPSCTPVLSMLLERLAVHESSLEKMLEGLGFEMFYGLDGLGY